MRCSTSRRRGVSPRSAASSSRPSRTGRARKWPMARLPPTRKYRKRKPGRDRPLPPPGKGELRIRQVRSGIGRPAFERRTLEALGLKHHQAVVVKQDRPSLRGMLYQVRRTILRSEEHTSELQSPCNLACRPLLEKKKNTEVTLFGYRRICNPPTAKTTNPIALVLQ